MILTAFESLTIATRTIFARNMSPADPIRNYKVEFLSITSTILLRLKHKNIDKELNAKSLSAVIVTLKKVNIHL
jgi:hypothetical protein